MSVLTKKPLKLVTNFLKARYYSQLKPSEHELGGVPQYIHLCGSFTVPQNVEEVDNFVKGVTVINDFISEAEEKSILDEILPYLKRMRYEFDHWDNAIHGYRETERLNWNPENNAILDKVRALAFPKDVDQIKHVHILDLDPKGYIKPHIDAVRFCGNTIAGLSLLTDSVMRFVHEKKKEFVADILLKRRSLYILTGNPRYYYTHEILKNEVSEFRGVKVEKGRRISVICRNAPNPEDREK